MFERFTDQARYVVTFAHEEARLLDQNRVDTEHLLLGLLDETGTVACEALVALGISGDAVRSLIMEIDGPGTASVGGDILFSARAKRVLELALREALTMHSNFIGPEHILLGLASEGDSVGVKVLIRLGAHPAQIRTAVKGLLQAEALAAARGTTKARQPSERMGVVALEALLAFWEDDLDQLREKLGRAMRLAVRAGDGEYLELLSQILVLEDPGEGKVRLQPRPDK